MNFTTTLQKNKLLPIILNKYTVSSVRGSKSLELVILEVAM